MIPSTAPTARRTRIDMRLAPETLSALDKLAAEAQINRTQMMEKLVRAASGTAAPDPAPSEASKTVAEYTTNRPHVAGRVSRRVGPVKVGVGSQARVVATRG